MAKGFCNPTNNPFKDVNGQWLTRAIFYETRSDSIAPMYTLKEEDFTPEGKDTFPSLKKIYLEMEHVPEFEYEFANKYLGGWIHWQRLLGSQVKHHFEQWREELTIKLKANAMKSIILTAYGETPTALQAAKYLSDSGYQMKRGRPSKLEKEARLKQDSAVDKQIEEDMKRMNLKAVK